MNHMINTAYNDHPKYKEILSCGVKNEIQLKSAFLVYLDLAEIHGWYDIELHPCLAHELMFLSGCERKGGPRQLVFPLDSSHVLSIDNIHTVLNSLQISHCDTDRVSMAVCDRDSSIVYYNLTRGIVPPDTPEMTEEKKQERISASQRRMQEVSTNLDLYLDEKRRKTEDVT